MSKQYVSIWLFIIMIDIVSVLCIFYLLTDLKT